MRTHHARHARCGAHRRHRRRVIPALIVALGVAGSVAGATAAVAAAPISTMHYHGIVVGGADMHYHG